MILTGETRRSRSTTLSMNSGLRCDKLATNHVTFHRLNRHETCHQKVDVKGHVLLSTELCEDE